MYLIRNNESGRVLRVKSLKEAHGGIVRELALLKIGELLYEVFKLIFKRLSIKKFGMGIKSVTIIDLSKRNEDGTLRKKAK